MAVFFGEGVGHGGDGFAVASGEGFVVAFEAELILSVLEEGFVVGGVGIVAGGAGLGSGEGIVWDGGLGDL